MYGAWPVNGDAVAVLVGDVAGKGVETAALSAMVRFFVEARSWDTLSPAKVLEQANAMLLGRLPRDTFVTAFLGILSRDSLSYCNAGHLPPLHIRPERCARSTAMACRWACSTATATPRASCSWTRVTSCLRTPMGSSRRAERGPCTAPSASRSSWRDWQLARAAGARAGRARRRDRLGRGNHGRCRGPRPAAQRLTKRVPLEWGAWPKVHTRAGVDQLLSGNAVSALVEVLSGSEPVALARRSGERPLRERPEAGRQARPG